MGTELALRFALKVVTSAGEVIALEAASAAADEGSMMDVSYLNNTRRDSVQLVTTICTTNAQSTHEPLIACTDRDITRD